jgi:hypothetical protein
MAVQSACNANIAAVGFSTSSSRHDRCGDVGWLDYQRLWDPMFRELALGERLPPPRVRTGRDHDRPGALVVVQSRTCCDGSLVGLDGLHDVLVRLLPRGLTSIASVPHF